MLSSSSSSSSSWGRFSRHSLPLVSAKVMPPFDLLLSCVSFCIVDCLLTFPPMPLTPTPVPLPMPLTAVDGVPATVTSLLPPSSAPCLGAPVVVIVVVVGDLPLLTFRGLSPAVVVVVDPFSPDVNPPRPCWCIMRLIRPNSPIDSRLAGLSLAPFALGFFTGVRLILMFLSGEWLRGRIFRASEIFFTIATGVGVGLHAAPPLDGRSRLRFMFSTRSRKLTRPPIEKFGFIAEPSGCFEGLAPLKSMLRYHVLVRSLRGLGQCSVRRRLTLFVVVTGSVTDSIVSLMYGRLTGPSASPGMSSGSAPRAVRMSHSSSSSSSSSPYGEPPRPFTSSSSL
uniref:Uncharacterized protein n=1 Tax=Anopheles atroparvus TaxID=41427 RepID=A0A182J600_ANOAO